MSPVLCLLLLVCCSHSVCSGCATLQPSWLNLAGKRQVCSAIYELAGRHLGVL